MAEETTPKHYIYGAILFTFMIVGVITLLTEIDSNTSGGMSENQKFQDFKTELDKRESLAGNLSTIQRSIEGADGESNFGAFGVLNSLINKAWQTLKGLFTTFKFVGDAFTSASSIFGIPGWVMSILLLLVVVMIAFSIWSAIFQKNF